MGDRAGLLPTSRATLRPGAAARIGARAQARAEVAGVFVNPPLDEVAEIADALGLTILQLHGDEGPAFCGEVAPDRRRGDQGRARRGRRRHPGARARSTPTSTWSTRTCRGVRGGTGERFDWALRKRAAARAAGPLRRADAGERRRGDRASHPFAVDVAQRHRGRARGQGPGEARAFFRGRGRRPRDWTPPRSPARRDTASQAAPRRAPLRRLRRPVRPRDADAGARRARGAPGARRGRPGLPRRARRPAARLRRAADAALPRRAAVARPAGAPIWLKREDLNHTGAHKINNALGQALLAKRMGKPRIIAETGAGQHGVATATVVRAARARVRRLHGRRGRAPPGAQRERMQLLGARSSPVDVGSRTLKDAVNEAMRDWVDQRRDTHYLLGSAVGPHPFPRSCATSSA